MVGVQAMVLGRLGMKPSPHPRACALSCPSPFKGRGCRGSGLYNAPLAALVSPHRTWHDQVDVVSYAAKYMELSETGGRGGVGVI